MENKRGNLTVNIYPLGSIDFISVGFPSNVETFALTLLQESLPKPFALVLSTQGICMLFSREALPLQV